MKEKNDRQTADYSDDGRNSMEPRGRRRREQELLLALLADELGISSVNREKYEPLSEEEQKSFLQLCIDQDLTAMAGDCLLRRNFCLLPEIRKNFEQEIIAAIKRCESQKKALRALSDVMDEADIDYIPLKGAVIRNCYPQPWMRTSCDVDVLFRTDELQKAVALTREKMACTVADRSPHDIKVEMPNGVYLELHHRLVEDDYTEKASLPLADVWAHAVSASGTKEYRMSEEVYYCYHIAHMAKHFMDGGCGIRFFVDLWLLNKTLTASATVDNPLLKQGGMETFADTACRLAEYWLEGKPANENVLAMEQYILSGGIYGSAVQHAAMNSVRSGGKGSYMVSRFWLPYEILCLRYPELEKHPHLMICYQLRRWFDALKNGKLGRVNNEMMTINDITDEKKQSMQNLLHRLGLE